MNAVHQPNSISSSTRILVVDDEPVVREAICRLLVGHLGRPTLIESAASITAACAVVPHFRPHLVLLDMDLGGEDGLRLLRHLPSGTDVIVVTSQADAEGRAKARRAGVRRVVDKKHGASALLQIVARTLTPQVRGELCTDAGGESSVGDQPSHP